MRRPEAFILVDKQLVWMTCGEDAGYQLLLAPPVKGLSWVDLLEQAFPRFEIGGQRLRSAEVGFDGGRAVAVAFFDPSHCDSSSRPIKHFMLWLDPDETMLRKVQQLDIPALLGQLAPAFEVILRAPRNLSEQQISREAAAKQLERTLRLEFTAKAPKPAAPAKPASRPAPAKVAPPPRPVPTLALGPGSQTLPNQSITDIPDAEEALGFPRKLLWLLALAVLFGIVAAVVEFLVVQ